MQGINPPAGLGRKGGLGTAALYIRLRRHCETFVNSKLDLVARVPDAEP